MIPNIKISKYNGIKECKLLDLNKVNVICGKNNSGKTSILEGIDGKKNTASFSYGLIFSDNELKRILENTINMHGFGRRSRLITYYKNIFNKTFSTESIWYSNEAKLFSEQLLSSWSNGPESQPLNNNAIEEAFNEIFTFEKKSILIPSLRSITVTKTISTTETVHPSGEGVLNSVFDLKSRTPQNKKYITLQEEFHLVTNGYTFDVGTFGKQNKIKLSFKGVDGPFRDASKCGLGLQDVLLILYFIICTDNNLLLIEEIENHIHPDIQRKLISFIKRRTNNNQQFIISTHSNIISNPLFIDRVFFVYYDDEVHVDNATSRAQMLLDMGFSVADNLVSNLTVLVEGPSDKIALEQLMAKTDWYSNFVIKIWPLGGDIMDQLDLSIFLENYKVIALIDKDPESKPIREKFKENCEKEGIEVKQLDRYAIENYYSLRVLKKVFKGQIKYDQKLDPNKKLKDQIGIDVKKNTGKITRQMNFSEIEGTDLEDFLNRIKELCSI